MKDFMKEAADKARAKQRAWVLDRKAKGDKPVEIAVKLGLSRQRVHQILKGE